MQVGLHYTWAFLIIIAILAGLALCTIYAMVLLLTNEKSRAVLKGLLSVPAVLIVVSAGYYLMMVRTPSLFQSTRLVQEVPLPDDSIDLGVKTACMNGNPLSATSQIDVSQSESKPKKDDAKPKPDEDAKPEPLEATIEDVASSDRPAWIDAEPQLVGSEYEMPITVGPYQTRLECEAHLSEAADKAVDQYVVLRLGPKAKGKVHLPLDFVREHLFAKEALFEEWKKYSVGRMVKLHALMRFDSSVNQRLDEEWRRVVVRRRLGLVGLSCTALLLILSMAYAFLKVDLATEGGYRGRMKIAFSAIVLAVVVAGIALAKR